MIIQNPHGTNILINKMKHLKTFKTFESAEALKNYTDQDPIHFEEVFGINDDDISVVLSDLIDKYDYLDFETTSENYKNFSIEIYEANADPKEDLKDEYREFINKILPNMKKWLDDSNLKLDGHKYDDNRHRIIINVSPLKLN